MITHTVLFKLREDAQKLSIMQQFKEAIEALPQSISIIRSIAVDFNINPAEEWDLILTSAFDSLEDLSAYSAHPLHIAAASIIAPLKEARACVDASID